jgi:CheY-like chemotaxis protein
VVPLPTMRMRFPVRSSNRDAVSTTTLVPGTSLRILLVDDDPLILKSLRDALEADGHVVATANGGQAGIDAFRTSHQTGGTFAIVITDLGMPYVDGRRVASNVKAISPATPVIMLTGWGQRLIAEGDIPAHVDCVLSKPPKLHEVRAALARVCSGKQG